MSRVICLAAALIAAFFVFGAPSPALAGVTVKIDISDQRMRVYVNGARNHSWAISSGRGNYRTPRGSFRPTRMHRTYHSVKYHGAPMPHSIFFYGGYAIHGTNHISALGQPASHGCVRLHPDHARHLFNLVRQHGPRNTRIVIQN
ncbi:MAG: L,D-transpeptidase [Pseudomonadota bacterium]